MEGSNGFAADEIAPGVRRMRTDDHFLILSEGDATPMHVGALIFLDVPAAELAGAYDRLVRHFVERLPGSPLLCAIHQCPDGYDSDVWADVAACDEAWHFDRISERLDGAQLRKRVAELVMERLDLSRPPFRVHIFDNLADGGVALYFKMHHGLADGVGFQTVLGLLSDDHGPTPGIARDAALPSPSHWHRMAEERFAREESLREEKRAKTKETLELLKSGSLPQRPQTPVLRLSGPTATTRDYATWSVPLDRVKALAKALGGTINDVFLALASGAVRRLLIELDDLPADPIVVNSARSYRRPEHGDFGNRIVAMHPHLATNIADPVARFRAIQAEMEREKSRTAIDESLLDAPEKPYGAKERRERFAQRRESGGSILPGNITLSNVPGPAQSRSYAGFVQIANHPVPLLGAGRFLNITSRRSGDNLDMGLMVDPTKIPDAARVGVALDAALAEYEGLAA